MCCGSERHIQFNLQATKITKYLLRLAAQYCSLKTARLLSLWEETLPALEEVGMLSQSGYEHTSITYWSENTSLRYYLTRMKMHL